MCFKYVLLFKYLLQRSFSFDWWNTRHVSRFVSAYILRRRSKIVYRSLLGYYRMLLKLRSVDFKMIVPRSFVLTVSSHFDPGHFVPLARYKVTLDTSYPGYFVPFPRHFVPSNKTLRTSYRF